MNATGRIIVVTVAPVHDGRVPVALDPSRGRVDPASVRWILNPSDTIALEQALRIRDRHPEFRIRAISVAPPEAETALRECLAVGADEVVRVWGEGIEDADPHGVAAILAAAAGARPFDLILSGWRRADFEHAQTGPMLAELLGLPQITCARSVAVDGDPATVRVEKRVPGSLLFLSCALPALVTLEKGPPLRYPKYPDRRRAAKIRIPCLAPAAVGLSAVPAARVRLERVTPPKPRRRSAMGDTAAMPVVARLQRILAGGASTKTESNIRPCPDAASTRKIVEYLLKERLVSLP